MSRSRGQRSRSIMQLCEKIVMGLNHKGMIGSCIKLIHRMDIDFFFKMAKGQGHKVKVKYKIIRKSDWAANHEQKSRS